jgi:hypothetical protein
MLSCGDCGSGPTAPSSPKQASTQSAAMFQPPVTLYAVGDIANCSPQLGNMMDGKFGHEHVARLLETLGLDGINRVLLVLGDLAYYQGSSEQFANCYNLTWGKFLNVSRPTPGNHEYETRDALGYAGYFGSRAGNPGKLYYSFDPSGSYWHVISGNGNLVGAEKSSYLAWLESDLTQSSRPCTIFYNHYPRFSSGVAGSQRETEEEFEILFRHSVEMIVSGHDHNYERFLSLDSAGRVDNKGVTQFVVGTGGVRLTPLAVRQPGSVIFNNTSVGVLEITLGPGNYQFQFLKATGSFSDSGSGVCH